MNTQISQKKTSIVKFITTLSTLFTFAWLWALPSILLAKYSPKMGGLLFGIGLIIFSLFWLNKASEYIANTLFTAEQRMATLYGYYFLIIALAIPNVILSDVVEKMTGSKTLGWVSLLLIAALVIPIVSRIWAEKFVNWVRTPDEV